jgi:hypothetical protein
VRIAGKRTRPVKFDLPEGGAKRVRVQFSSRVTRLLARRGSLAALVTFRVHEGGAPGVGTGSARITVKPARKR